MAADCDDTHLESESDGKDEDGEDITIHKGVGKTYRFSRVPIAYGGMGIIRKGHDKTLDVDIAGKFLNPNIGEDLDSNGRLVLIASCREKLIDEARTTARLDHPNIVPVHDLGTTENGELFFTMKYIRGSTLKELLEEDLLKKEKEESGPLDDRYTDYIQILLKVCDAIAYAHDKGIIHQDLKPDNIMVGSFHEVYVLDWGVARREEDRRHGGYGTPIYMSPEQAFGLAGTTRTDVFGIGAILYEVLTGFPPYPADPDAVYSLPRNQIREEIQKEARAGEPVPPENRVPDVSLPEVACAIVKKAMSTDPAFRYPSVRELRAALEAFLTGGQYFEKKTYAEGDTIVSEGKPGGDEAYMIVRGRCQVTQMRGGQRITLGELGSGDVFGEFAVLADTQHTTTVTALGEVVVKVVSRSSLDRHVGSNTWPGRFLRALATRSRTNEELISEAAIRYRDATLHTRALAYLMEAGEDTHQGRCADWPVLKESLAQDFRMTVEQVGEILSKAEGLRIDAATGLISKHGQQTITTREALDKRSSWRAQVSAFLIDCASDAMIDSRLLLGFWQNLKGGEKQQRAEVYRGLAKRFLDKGEFLLAIDVIKAGLESSNAAAHDRRLRQLHALALCKSGAREDGRALAKQIVDALHRDEESLGILARTSKDLWEADRREELLVQAYEDYSKAHRETEGYWTGVNAASLAHILARTHASEAWRGHYATQAEQLAREVASKCRDLCAKGGDAEDELVWPYATMGEAALVLGEYEEAKGWYAKAVRAAGDRWGFLASMRHQLSLLEPHLDTDLTRDDFVPMPRIAVFVGHMVDQEGRPSPRFPRYKEADIKEAIGRLLAEHHISIGYASAACGSDILFHEALLERGGEAHVILPYPAETFRSDSVDIAKGDWGARFNALLEKATLHPPVMRYALEERSVAYDFAGRMVQGIAAVAAEQLETDLLCLAVWDNQKGDGPGGTQTAVERWRNQGYAVHVIDPHDPVTVEIQIREQVAEPAAEVVAHTDQDQLPPEIHCESQIVGLFYADVHRFRDISEDQMPLFTRFFWGGIADVIERSHPLPVMRNTWGDAIFLVYDDVEQAGEVALAVAAFLGRRPWAEHGLPPGLTSRMVVHAGPVFRGENPVTGLETFFGNAITLAARLEHATPPGEIYATQEFAAYSAMTGERRFSFTYVGQQDLIKRGGTVPAYHLRRARA